MSRNGRINVAVVGVGLMGETHIRAYLNNPFTNVVSIADADEARAKEMAAKYSINRYYTDYGEMLDKEDLQAISVATPERYHRGPAEKAAKMGIHVLCEKPIAATMKDALVIVDACSSSKVKLLVGYASRFEPIYTIAKERIQEGKVGQINLIRSHRTDPISITKRVSEWTNLIFYDAVHDIDLVQWYSESRVVRVYAEGSSKLLGSKGPDVIQATLKLDDGAVGSIATNWIVPDKKPTTFEQRTEVWGTKGVMKIEVDNRQLQIDTSDGSEYPDTVFFPTMYGHPTGAVKEEIDHFVNCIRKDLRPLVGGEEGVQTLSVALAIIESYNTGQIVATAKTK